MASRVQEVCSLVQCTVGSLDTARDALDSLFRSLPAFKLYRAVAGRERAFNTLYYIGARSGDLVSCMSTTTDVAN